MIIFAGCDVPSRAALTKGNNAISFPNPHAPNGHGVTAILLLIVQCGECAPLFEDCLWVALAEEARHRVLHAFVDNVLDLAPGNADQLLSRVADYLRFSGLLIFMILGRRKIRPLVQRARKRLIHAHGAGGPRGSFRHRCQGSCSGSIHSAASR